MSHAESPPGTRDVTDQMRRQVRVPTAPWRIVSLVPSQTELLFHLGAGDRVVGVTDYCVHPADLVKTKRSIGGTKRFRFDVLDELRPDLAIGNKEENYVEGIDRLAHSCPVWMSDVRSLEDNSSMVRAVGNLVGCGEEADRLATGIERRFARLHPADPPLRVAYLIWRKPWMAAGSDTFIDDLLGRCGLANVFAAAGSRYPRLDLTELRDAKLDLVLLSSEPFPFEDKHRTELEASLGGPRILLVDGEFFSWYGSRLLAAADYLEGFLTSL